MGRFAKAETPETGTWLFFLLHPPSSPSCLTGSARRLRGHAACWGPHSSARAVELLHPTSQVPC